MAFEPPKLPIPSITDSYQKKLQEGVFGAVKQNTRLAGFESKLPGASIGSITDGLSDIEITAKKINVASPTTPDVAAAFLPNMLDDYDSYTYHFKLYVMNEKVFESGSNDFGPSSKQEKIILAESGVTGISIDDVTFTSTIGLTKATGSTYALEFQFTLTQPHGATVMDYFVAANQKLGNKNWMKVPYYLELTFRARTPDGTTDQKPIKDDSLANLVWVFPLLIQEVNINVNTGGSAYVVTAAMYSNLAYTNQTFDLESGTTVEAATVGEFFTGLQEKLNLRETEKKTSGQFVPDEYEIFVDPVFINETLVSGNIDSFAARNGAYAVEGTTKVGMSFQPATSLDMIAKSILSCTDYLKKASTGQKNPEVVSEEGIKQEAAKQTLFRIVADTQIIRWDAGRRDYARKYRYLILPHQLTTLQTPTNELAGLDDAQRFAIIAPNIKKQYNYIYTGLNDQVLDFDLTFNMAWYAAMSIQAGIVSNTSTAEPGGVIDQQNTQEEQIKQQDQQVQQRQQEANVSMSGVNASLNAVTQESSYNEKTSVSQDMIDNTNAIFRRDAPGILNPNSPLSAPFGTQPGINTGADQDQFGRLTATDFGNYAKNERIAAISKKLTGNLDQFDRGPSSTYIERETLGESDPATENPIVISYIESSFGQSMNASGDNVSTTGRSLLSSLFDQAEKNIAMGDLFDIELKIKGDPYWIEPPAVGRNAKLESVLDKELAKRGMGSASATPDTEVVAADYISGQSYFIFNSVTASEWDPVTGLRPEGAARNNLISGVYAVIEIRHEFSQGQFVQTLVATRDPKINIGRILVNSQKLPNEKTTSVNQEKLVPERGDVSSVAEVAGGMSAGIPNASSTTDLGDLGAFADDPAVRQGAKMATAAGWQTLPDGSVTKDGRTYTADYIRAFGYPAG